MNETNEQNGLPELPKGWTKANLEAFTEIILGQSPPSSTYNNKGIGLPFYQGKTEFGSIYPMPVKSCSSTKKIAEKNDVLISVRAPVGATNICPEKSCIGRGLAAIRGLAEINTRFILYSIRAHQEEITSHSTGTTFDSISGDKLKRIEFPLPPLNEQARIVAKIEELFTKLDAGIDALRAIQKQIKRYRQAVLRDAVTGELTKAWREENHAELEPADALLKRILTERRARWEQEQLKKFAESGKTPKNADWKKKYKEPAAPSTENPPELPESWTWATVEQVSKKVQYGSSAKTNEDSSGIPVLRMGNIFDGRLITDNLKYLPEDHNEFPELILEVGDVLFNRTNSAELVGKTAVYKGNPKPCSFASYLIKANLSENYLPDFIAYFINSFFGRKWIASVVNQQVGQANVNGTKLQALAVPLPPLTEQQKIVEEVERLLSVADAIEQTVKQSLKQAERLRQSILKRAFEGKLALQDETDEPAEILLKRIKQEREKIDKSKKTKGKFTRKNQKENKQAKLF